MVGTGSAKFRKARGVFGIDEAQDLFVVLNRPDKPLLAADLPAQPGKESSEDLAANLFGKAGVNSAAEGSFVAAFFGVFLFDELRGALNQVERTEIAFAVVVGPVDEAMLAHHDADGLGVLAANLLHFEAKLKSGAEPWCVNDFLAVDFLCEPH